mmetsp:Transcript_7689/g.12228  ORF Transcript_7689/g.12228 Transcript_7689/m.12228 type:complete len:179 (-) Transcript_7689:102-638(-)
MRRRKRTTMTRRQQRLSKSQRSTCSKRYSMTKEMMECLQTTMMMRTKRRRRRRKKKKTTSSSSSSENDDGSGGQDDPDAEAFRKEPFPTPLDYVVARWDSDPFALGSYSYLKLGATWPQIEDLARPYPAKDPHIFFAGEATSLEGIQCVTGAYKSGLRAAKQILADIANRRRGFIHTK